MKTDPIPRQPTDYPAVPSYFNSPVGDDEKQEIQYMADVYREMDDEERAEQLEVVSSDIRNFFKKNNLTVDRIDEIIEGLAEGTDTSQYQIDMASGVDDEEIDLKYDTVRGYDQRPSELLSAAYKRNTGLCAEAFMALDTDVQWMYLLSLRATVMARHLSGSSYSELSVYGKLPSEIVEQEAELYIGIVDIRTKGATQSEAFLAARENPNFALDNADSEGPLLPVDIRSVCVSDSVLNEALYENRLQIAVDYLQAAAIQLRSVTDK